jgi:hypothetical protein
MVASLHLRLKNSLIMSILQMLRTLMVCLALGLAAAVPTDKDTLNILFSKFVKEHGKVYNTREEMIHRQKIFAENLQKIEQHNRAGASYKMGRAC